MDFTRMDSNTHIESGDFGSISHNTIKRDEDLKTSGIGYL